MSAAFLRIVSIAALSLIVAAPAGAAPDLALVRELLASASYAEALEVLGSLESADNAEVVEQYRALCLLGLGRTADAERARVIGVVAHDAAQIAAARGDDLAGHAIGFGVHRGRIERLGAVGDAQEPGTLLEGALAEARYLEQRLAGAERAIGVAMRDDGLGDGRAKTGDTREHGQCARCASTYRRAYAFPYGFR